MNVDVAVSIRWLKRTLATGIKGLAMICPRFDRGVATKDSVNDGNTIVAERRPPTVGVPEVCAVAPRPV